MEAHDGRTEKRAAAWWLTLVALVVAGASWLVWPPATGQVDMAQLDGNVAAVLVGACAG